MVCVGSSVYRIKMCLFFLLIIADHRFLNITLLNFPLLIMQQKALWSNVLTGAAVCPLTGCVQCLKYDMVLGFQLFHCNRKAEFLYDMSYAHVI